jgi:hypothetical protein|tara:strand:- start:180 stop:341 length:162 start_codon:yes stop_codon:yes gene_type:complete
LGEEDEELQEQQEMHKSRRQVMDFYLDMMSREVFRDKPASAEDEDSPRSKQNG